MSKERMILKKYFPLYIAVSFIWGSCITEYQQKDIKDTAGILVVEGMILEPTGTFVKLSLSKSINSVEPYTPVNDATVSLLCDDGTSMPLNLQINHEAEGTASGVYKLDNSISFNMSAKYAIEISRNGKIYQSSYVQPLRTPDMNLTWDTQNEGRQVNIRVSTHDPEKEVLYYRWSYKEDWEIIASTFTRYRYDQQTQSVEDDLTLETSHNYYYCWGKDSSKSFLLASAEKQADAVLKNHRILAIKAENSRFIYLYSILVKQYALTKDAYEYYRNLQRNIDETGGIFSILPTEMEGNIQCLSDPKETVIGFIPATTEVIKRIFIKEEEVPNMKVNYPCTNIQFFPYSDTPIASSSGLGIVSEERPNGYYWLPIRCVDCTSIPGGTKEKPEWWPNDHL